MYSSPQKYFGGFAVQSFAELLRFKTIDFSGFKLGLPTHSGRIGGRGWGGQSLEKEGLKRDVVP